MNFDGNRGTPDLDPPPLGSPYSNFASTPNDSPFSDFLSTPALREDDDLLFPSVRDGHDSELHLFGGERLDEFSVPTISRKSHIDTPDLRTPEDEESRYRLYLT
jgi:hypothetical protein